MRNPIDEAMRLAEKIDRLYKNPSGHSYKEAKYYLDSLTTLYGNVGRDKDKRQFAPAILRIRNENRDKIEEIKTREG